MSRPYKYYRQSDFRGGICMEPENAETNQVLDARNVWAPEGKIVSRPGYVGLGAYYPRHTAAAAPATYRFVGKDGVLNDGTTDVNADAMTTAQYLYVGIDALPSAGLVGIDINYDQFGGTVLVTPNSNKGGATLEYWDGSSWSTIPYWYEHGDSGSDQFGKFLGYSAILTAAFVAPADWATTAVAGSTLYWVRFRPLATTNNGDLTSVLTVTYHAATTVYAPLATLVDFSNQQVYLSVEKNASSTYLLRRLSLFREEVAAGASIFTGVSISVPQRPWSAAVVPEASRIYVACPDAVLEITPTTAGRAEVNTLQEIVGTVEGVKSPYHPDYVPQLLAFPKADLTTYFKGLLWFAGIDGEPFTVRWSAPAIDGAYNVLPEDSFEILAEDDNSPITALAGLNEHLVVFKQDSIWLMVYSGLNDLELPTFTPVKVVSGVGCVAHGSVQQVRGKLIFLGEDGVYAFDGTPNVQKLSETIDVQLGKIRKGRRQAAVATHWQTQNAYLLAISLDTDTESTTTTAALEPNNFVFVYDYAHGAWWFWDSVEAQAFLRDTSPSGEERIYFIDSKGRYFWLSGNHDNGAAINAYFTTHRFGQNDAITTTAREVRVRSTNVAGECDITLISTDEDGTAATMELQHSAEDAYGTAVYGTDTYSAERRVERKLARRTQGRWHQVKVAHDQKYKRFECTGVDLGYIVEGRR